MTKPLYLGLSILDISKTLMYEFWYDYIKPKYGDKAKLCYMNNDSFVIYVETEGFYKDIADDVDRWFDTSNYDENNKRSPQIGKNKKIPGLFKDELGGKIMAKFVALRAKAYAYVMDDDSEHKKAKGTKKCVINCNTMVKDYIDPLFKDKIILKTQQAFRSDNQNVYTVEINKTELSNNDDKTFQTCDKVTTYPHGQMHLKGVKVK